MKGLGKILQDNRFSVEKEDILCYGYDASGIDHSPSAVVWPLSTSDVIKVSKFAYENSYKLIPRGAGTGMTGGSIPSRNSILLSFEKMNRIIDIDRENLHAVVEPGVINGKLQRELEAIGYFYPPDPASMHSCTIGGNVAENAGGPRALKYGVTKDYVMELEAVLADGRLIRTGVQTVKGVVGYDLTGLLVGSEGTLATITKIRLKILPLPENIITLLSFHPSVDSAGKTVSRIIALGIIPRTLEIMDRATISAINHFKPVGLPEDIDAILLIELDGNHRAIKEEAEKVVKVCNGFNGEVKIAEDIASRTALWEARRSISPALFQLGPSKINEDIVIPRSKVAHMLTGLAKLSEKTGITIASFGHAGDGNIHVNIMTDRNSKEHYERAEKLVKEVFELTLSLGGTISGEHGIGLTKSKYIDMEIDPNTLDMMRGIKKLFDHKNILNPGKIFPS